MATWSIEADTPEEFRIQIRDWLLLMAQREHENKNMVNTKRHENACENRRQAYQNAALFVRDITIKPKS